VVLGKAKLKRGDLVRIDRSNPKEKTFYKSFLGLKELPQGLGKTKYKAHWSKIFGVTEVKKMGRPGCLGRKGRLELGEIRRPARENIILRLKRSLINKNPLYF
jgi:hypothetical protein